MHLKLGGNSDVEISEGKKPFNIGHRLNEPYYPTPRPNPIKVFSASTEATLKFNQSVRLKMVT